MSSTARSGRLGYLGREVGLDSGAEDDLLELDEGDGVVPVSVGEGEHPLDGIIVRLGVDRPDGDLVRVREARPLKRLKRGAGDTRTRTTTLTIWGGGRGAAAWSGGGRPGLWRRR